MFSDERLIKKLKETMILRCFVGCASVKWLLIDRPEILKKTKDCFSDGDNGEVNFQNLWKEKDHSRAMGRCDIH